MWSAAVLFILSLEVPTLSRLKPQVNVYKTAARGNHERVVAHPINRTNAHTQEREPARDRQASLSHTKKERRLFRAACKTGHA
jgi:TFIIF-interacting CTD phosphatase-like protein